MPYEKSAGAVIFKILRGKPQYLLLQHSKEYWNFPKGIVERGEDEIEAARREVVEETGLSNLTLMPKFRVRDHYLFRRKAERQGHVSGWTVKDVFFYLARARGNRVRISSEHSGYAWLSYEDAMKLLKYKGIRNVLMRANRYLVNMIRKKP